MNDPFFMERVPRGDEMASWYELYNSIASECQSFFDFTASVHVQVRRRQFQRFLEL